MHRTDSIVKLTDTDAAGILFYGNYFRLAHDAYESFIESVEFGLAYIINDADIWLLIAHAGSDFKTSLRLGDKYAIEIRVDNIGRTSFTLKYDFLKPAGELIASVKTVHVAVSKATGKPVSLPEKLRDNLTKHT
ncbi:MAG: acyl-CoA thioesterase [Candidatus Zixiibacteriota bacterium]|nr:MAG: acyl-CoA thioesterase [candidate division Zixibacteria bacterium]